MVKDFGMTVGKWEKCRKSVMVPNFDKTKKGLAGGSGPGNRKPFADL